jgi:hypothetical protein
VQAVVQNLTTTGDESKKQVVGEGLWHFKGSPTEKVTLYSLKPVTQTFTVTVKSKDEKEFKVQMEASTRLNEEQLLGVSAAAVPRLASISQQVLACGACVRCVRAMRVCVLVDCMPAGVCVPVRMYH